MGWRYYAQRASTGEWLDTNVQFSDPAVSLMLSSPNAMRAHIPVGINGNPTMSDGRPLFGKFDTLLLAEDETGTLVYFGVCTDVSPVPSGTDLEFISTTGWLAGVPYTGEYVVWESPLYNAIKELMSAARKVQPRIPFNVTYIGGQGLTIGDPQPPPQPDDADARRAWQEAHGWKDQYSLVWWEAPMVGKELDDFVKQYGINYIESVRWVNRGSLDYAVDIYIDDGVSTGHVRSDVEFVDGVNLAKPIDVKPGTSKFANRVIGLGAGEGRDMLMVNVSADDGRLYQAEVRQYKAIGNQDLLRRMAVSDLQFLHGQGVKIETLTVWDMPGFAPIASLVPGDEVRIKSANTVPPVDDYARIVSITRTPLSAVAIINFEVAK